MAINSNLKLPIFQIESFGAADGPGLRLVIFAQGCLYRCVYCHNPESWSCNKHVETITIAEILKKYNHSIEFYRNGGITISGGDPLLHLEFIKALAKVCYEKKISLALDTAGVNFSAKTQKDYLEICKYQPLWLVDIKQINKQKHKALKGVEEQKEIKLIEFLEKNKQRYWLRQVILPGWTDDPKDLINLGKFVSKLEYIENFQVLPFHQMAKNKYEKLNINYPLSKIKSATQEDIDRAKKYIEQGYNS